MNHILFTRVIMMGLIGTISYAQEADITRAFVCPITGPVANFCNAYVTNNLCVGGNIFASGTISGTSITSANYANVYDTTSQPVQVPNVFQDITFNTNAFINGWLHTTGTSIFTCAQTGLYLVQYQGVLNQSNEPGTVATIRATFNGTEVSGSAFTINLPITGDSIELSNSFFVSATQGQQLILQLTGSGSANNVQLSPNMDAEGTVNPSITITIVRIA